MPGLFFKGPRRPIDPGSDSQPQPPQKFLEPQHQQKIFEDNRHLQKIFAHQQQKVFWDKQQPPRISQLQKILDEKPQKILDERLRIFGDSEKPLQKISEEKPPIKNTPKIPEEKLIKNTPQQQQQQPPPQPCWDAPPLLSPSVKHKSCRPSQSLLNLQQMIESSQPCAAAAQCNSDGSEADHDLAALVHEFIENGSRDRDAADPDSDPSSAASSTARLCDSLKALGSSKSFLETELLAKVSSLLLSFSEESLDHPSSDCKGACLRLLIVRHLKSLGYDAAICKLKWQFCGSVPGGDYEYVDVVFESGGDHRLILDLDFQSQFEIARPTQTYRAALRLLPAVYVGSVLRLHRILEIMSEAAKASLQQNSMHLPPWRTIEYMFAKWLSSPHERSSSKVVPIKAAAENFSDCPSSNSNPAANGISRQLRLCCGAESVKPCWEQLRRIKEALRSAAGEIENPSSAASSGGGGGSQVKRGLGICLPRRRSSGKW